MPKFINHYDRLVAAGELRADPDQKAAVILLSNVKEELEAVPPRGSVIWRALGRKPKLVKGIYMWGGVGRGKSMLMDLFYNNVKMRRKRRAHFHEFMIEVHARLREERKKEKGDPIPQVVSDLAEQARLLCFDEMVVNNMADAAIMSRLFTGLIAANVTIVTTSNRIPNDLYKDGLNRVLFLPFIDLINDELSILSLNGPTDYRRERLGNATIWHSPNGDKATQDLNEIFFRLTDYPPEDRAHVPSETLQISEGRTLTIPRALKGVAVVSFKKICGEARGASDYLAMARKYHSIIMVGIPKLGPENRNEAARFVTFIDALYEYKVKFLASADAAPDNLYQKGDGKFEFERTVSRIMEMQSEDYLAQGHGTLENSAS